MGAVYHLSVENLTSSYNLQKYIQTGTGQGDCLVNMLPFNLKQYHSIQIHNVLASKARLKFNRFQNVFIHQGISYQCLDKILQKKVQGNVLFFLDAHFPGADFKFREYGDQKDFNKRLPLNKQLQIIKKHRTENKDVIIIDDLRIYQDGPYQGGNWQARKRYGSDSIKFVYQMFQQTHNIVKNFKQQGYLILLPIKK